MKRIKLSAVFASALLLATLARAVPVGTTDLAGNALSGLPFTAGETYILDATPPEAPTGLDLDPASDSGSLNTDNLTNDTTPTINGSGEVGATVTLYDTDGTTERGSTTVGPGGTWSIDATPMGAGEHTLTARQTDAAGNASDPSESLAIVLDISAPAATGSVRMDVNPTNASSVQFTVTFNEDVTGVDTSDFGLATTGSVTGASVASVSGNEKTYIVTASTGVGSGSLKLDVLDDDSIVDAAGNATASGFTSGESYTIDKAAPVVESIVRETGAVLNAGANDVVFRITFDDTQAVGGVDASDFTVTTVSGNASGQIASVIASGANSYDITVDHVAGLGSLKVDLNSGGTGIVDAAGNAIADGGFSSGDIYLVGTTNVFETTIIPGVVGKTAGLDLAVAQPFKTSAEGPMTVYHVAAQIGAVFDDPAVVVSIHADVEGAPGAPIATLTNPTSLVANQLNVWTTATPLAPNTSYWLVFSADSEISYDGGYVVAATAATTGGEGTWINAGAYAYGEFIASWEPVAGTLRIAIGVVSSPSITGVTPPTNGSYRSGQPLEFTVNYGAGVTVDTAGGTPRIPLTIGLSTVYASYVSGSPGSALLFRYTPQAGDNDSDGIAMGAAIDLNGGTIVGAADIDALLAFTPPDTASVLVDNVAPTVAGVNSSAANASYKAGDTVRLVVTFSEAVNVTGTPTLALNSSGSASYVDGSGTTALSFDYTIAAGNTASDLDYAATDSLALADGTINDAAGHEAILTLPAVGGGNSLGGQKNLVIDGIAPTVSRVDVPVNGTTKTGAALDFTVNFSEVVTITGSPYLGVTLDTGGTVQAVYEDGSGTSAIVFRYLVGTNTADADGIELAESLTANGGTIRDAAGNDAALALADVDSTTGVLVDGVAPVVTSIVRAGAAATNASTVQFIVAFAENVVGLAAEDFALTTTLADASVAGVSGSGAVYTIDVETGEGSGTLRLDLAHGGTAITDAHGNAIASGFTAGESYTIDRGAPAVVMIERQSPLTINSEAAALTWRLVFDEGVTGVDVGDLELATLSGTSSGSIAAVAAVDASTYDITVNTVAGRGELRLDLKASGTAIVDLAGNALTGGGFTAGEFYLTGVSNVFQATHLAADSAVIVQHGQNKTAQRFTTSAAAPLTLTTVTAMIGDVMGAPVPAVTVHLANELGGIGELVTTLTNPATLVAHGENVWTAATLLAPNTTYWLVFDESTSSMNAYDVALATTFLPHGLGDWMGLDDYKWRAGSAAQIEDAGVLSVAIGATSVPTITSALTASGQYGSEFDSYTITATNLPTSFGATGLPIGLSLDSETGVISGTPTRSGTFNVALTATNLSGEGAPSTLVIEIAKAPLTVTANPANRAYGAANPVFTVGYSGFVNSDTAAALTTTPTAATTATPTSPVGEYDIVPSGGSTENYTLSYTNGTLTVTKATATIAFDNLSRSYTGSPQTATVTTNPTGLTVNVTYDGGATAPTSPGSYAVAATIVDMNYQGASSGTLSIGRIPVAITFGNLEAVYDGTSKAVTATAAGGLPVTVTYNGATTAPTNAGSYAVAARVDTATHSGSATGTLVIAKAPQTIVFALPQLNLGKSALTATASSGLPVTFSVVSGPATVSGAQLTVTGSGTVTVRAAQAGNGNFAPATVDATAGVSGKLAQTIDFPEIAARTTLDGAFRLVATASSGLPVKFTVVSGPAIIGGRSLVLNGTPGMVVLRASQPGNDLYGAAVDAERSFEVRDATTSTFFGDLTSGSNAADDDVKALSLPMDGEIPITAKASKVGDIAASFTPGVGRGTLMIVAGSIGLNVVLDFSLEEDGSYTISFSNAGEPLTVNGALVEDTLNGHIPELNLSFSTQTEFLGATAAFAGFYQSEALETAQGVTYSIVGANGQALVLVVTPTVVTGGMADVASDGSFALNTSEATVTGAISAPASTVSGEIAIPGQPQVGFSGLRDLVLRTDRLINLSSRARVGAGHRTLIAGFVIGGKEAKTVLLRAAGPALEGAGLNGALANPQLHVFNNRGELLAQNDDWSGDEIVEASLSVGAYPFVEGSRDAALVTTLEPGVYTMHVSGGAESGLAVAEVYDASENPEGEYQRLINISSRGHVGAGDNLLIGGFVVTGNAPKRVLVRGVGPALVAANISDALADPIVRVFQGPTVIGENDNWSGDPAKTEAILEATTTTGAGQFVSGSKDAAMILTLAPGVYTVHVGGRGDATGVAMVEIYEIPE